MVVKHISLEGEQFRAQMAASQLLHKRLRDPDSFSLLLYSQCMASIFKDHLMMQDDTGAVAIVSSESQNGKRHNAIQNEIEIVFLRKKVKTDVRWQLVVSAIDLLLVALGAKLL